MRTLLLLLLALPLAAAEKPNIIWIVTEDISPNLGCYGDKDARTPNLDAFAKQSARFTRAFTHAPVCAPSRSGLITGVYPTTLGSHHMRSKLVKAPQIFLDDLKAAGYRVFWPGKTDFNFDPAKDFADTRNWVKDPKVLEGDTPFFAFHNIGVTHESKARATPEEHAKIMKDVKESDRHNPDNIALPPYYPDTPIVRKNVAMYHDNITAMDHIVGDILKMLDDKKLSENTIVFFFGDHGWGLPRGKRWCYDSGTRVPLLIRWPGTLRPGSVRDDLVCFLDFAPTVLSLAGAEIPEQMQGRVMLGAKAQTPPKFVVSCRDRMDETYDRIRSLRNDRYRYIRNFHPELPYAQWLNYLDEMPIMKEWRRLAFEGKLSGNQRAFFARTKPAEELYDLELDPFETNNLAESPVYKTILTEMHANLEKWMLDTRDLGAKSEQALIDKGLVKNLLGTEYAERIKLHPKTSPVP